MVRMAAGLAAVLAAAALPSRLEAQHLLDWPIRPNVTEARTRGAGAAFANPAGAALEGGARVQALLLQIRGPEATGLGGVAAAVSADLSERVAVLIGYAHVGIEDIPRTTTSPVPDGPGSAIEVSEDRFAAGAAYQLARGVRAGVAAEHTRAAAGSDERSWTALGLGVLGEREGPFAGSISAALRLGGGGTEWRAGASADAALGARVRVGGTYAVEGGAFAGLEHRLVATARYAEWAEASGGASGREDVAGTTWQPVLAARLRLGRYGLGVVRDALPGGVGAAYWFRLSADF